MTPYITLFRSRFWMFWQHFAHDRSRFPLLLGECSQTLAQYEDLQYLVLGVHLPFDFMWHVTQQHRLYGKPTNFMTSKGGLVRFFFPPKPGPQKPSKRQKIIGALIYSPKSWKMALAVCWSNSFVKICIPKIWYRTWTWYFQKGSSCPGVPNVHKVHSRHLCCRSEPEWCWPFSKRRQPTTLGASVV